METTKTTEMYEASTDRLTIYDAQLDAADEAYWTKNQPIMEDFQYDMLLFKRNELAEDLDLPLRITADSSIFSLNEAMSKVPHLIPNYSLDRIKFENQSNDKMLAQKPVQKLLEEMTTKHVVLQPKLDGLSISIQMNEDGRIYFLTRGKGGLGEDVTHHFKNDRRFATMSRAMKPGDVIRGEVVTSLTYAAKHKLSRIRQYTVGVIKRKAPQNLKNEGLKFVAYTYYPYTKRKLSINEQLYELANTFGLETINNDVLCIFRPEDLANKIDLSFTMKLKSDYEKASDSQIDGLMFKAMEVDEYFRDNKSMSGSLAVKFPPDLFLTKLTEVEFREGATGKITPMAYFEEVIIDGSSVSKASLGSVKSMEELAPKESWKLGMYIKVGLANDIVPHVYEANVAFEEMKLEEAWLEWRNSHAEDLVSRKLNGSLLGIKSMNTFKNKIRDTLKKGCCFRDIDSQFINRVSLRDAKDYVFYDNIADYLIDSIEYVMNVNLRSVRMNPNLKTTIRNNRARIKSLTFKNVIRNSFSNIADAVEKSHKTYTLDNVVNIIQNDPHLNSQMSYMIPVYTTLYKYCRK